MSNQDIKLQILNKIKEYDKIVITRHIRPDGDCVGGTLGLREIIKETFPEKTCKILVEDYINYTEFLGVEDCDPDFDYQNSLFIVFDTSNKNRISNSNIDKASYIIKIDHHIETDPYGDINWVEDKRSSASEMIVDFYKTFENELILSKKAAEMIYVGIITDNGRFRYSQTSSDTLHLAAVLLDKGIEIEKIYAQLYTKDYENFKFQIEISNEIKRSKNRVLYVFVSKEIQEKYQLSHTDASNVVSLMDSVKDSYIWIAFIDNSDGSIRVRIRSRFIPINSVGEAFNGGGHANASGATVYSLEEMDALIEMCDALVYEYENTSN